MKRWLVSIYLIVLLLFLIVGYSQYSNSHRGNLYSSSINGKDVYSIEIFSVNSEEFFGEYVNSPERQLVSKAIDNAAIIDDKNVVEYDYFINVNYVDKSTEKYWFELNSSKFKKGEGTYLMADTDAKQLSNFLLMLEKILTEE